MRPSLAIRRGVWLKEEIVDPDNVTITRLVDAFGISRQALSDLFHGRAALTADMALAECNGPVFGVMELQVQTMY